LARKFKYAPCDGAYCEAKAESSTCAPHAISAHGNGGGVSEDSRASIANELIGGMKLIAAHGDEFGGRPIIGTNTYGATSNIMTGPIGD
jgi:hypothetical protein